jgi:alpha-galactosidase
VHGCFGVISEMLDMEPGDLDVITGGVNHFNWLVDIRRKGSTQSFMAEFMKRVKDNQYWLKHHPMVPEQTFTLEILKAFGAYPVGYDDHIVEYLPFFYEQSEWAEHGFESILTRRLKPTVAQGEKGLGLEAMTLLAEAKGKKYPFPKDYSHPYYDEKPCHVIEAFESQTPTYFDAINIVNHGSIGNLPEWAIVDIPALAVCGSMRGIHVGDLPVPAAELCRRQITLHELIARAAYTGDESLVVQSFCLDPYVHSITQARKIWADFKKEFKEYLPSFKL